MPTPARLMVALAAIPLLSAFAPGAPSGRYLGQDGHDLVGESARPGPSQIQDMHFVLAGLPAGDVVAATVKGQGEGEWRLGGPPGAWLALIDKAPGATVADVYLEPYKVETGRRFEFALTFDDGRTLTIAVRGGRADPNLRVTSERLEARWVGQDRRDFAGGNPNVGPDGYQDAHVALSRLAPGDEIRSVLVAGPGDLRWQAGPNHEALTGAECIRDPADLSRADLFFQPPRDLAGLPLKVTVTYGKGKADAATLIAGRCKASLDMGHAAVANPLPLNVRATWLGQAEDGQVRVGLDGLPDSGRIASFALADGEVAWWSDRPLASMPGALPMAVRKGPTPAQAELRFSPVRDESAATMTLGLALDDGRSAFATFPGGPANPALLGPAPAGSKTEARPGDDLNALANSYGTVTLAAGVYSLTRPLVLDRPVTITSEGGATILFRQGPAEPPWTAAIKIRAGRTTLDRVAIRFGGPVRWDAKVGYGPAAIGTTDDRDRPTGRPLAGLRFTRLDIEGSPPSGDWEEAPRLLRLLGATGGLIEGCRLKGGLIEAWGGPWRIVDNRQDGPHGHAFAHALISLHEPHDLLIARNRARLLDPAAKAWRWLVLTNRGQDVAVVDNTVEGVGPRDGDRVEHPNAPETILTESYRLDFEGKPSGVSPDGRVVAIASPQGGRPSPGAVLAILSGPQAGQWRRVVLPVGPNSYLLDRPVATGGGAVSIASGFVATRFEGNRVDDRGSKIAKPFVLAGHHFGTRLMGNRTLGGGDAALILATASESPIHWGWSHNPMFGLTIEGNTFEDSRDGLRLAVEHGPPVRTSRGRVYFTATFAGNTIARSEPFLSAYARENRGGSPPALVIGREPSGDPGELVLVESGNRRVGGGAGPAISVHNGTVNGRPIRDGRLDFGPGSSGRP